MSKRRYRVLTGLNYRNRRADPGEVVDDIPARSVRWLLDQGHIEPAGEAAEGEEDD